MITFAPREQLTVLSDSGTVSISSRHTPHRLTAQHIQHIQHCANTSSTVPISRRHTPRGLTAQHIQHIRHCANTSSTVPISRWHTPHHLTARQHLGLVAPVPTAPIRNGAVVAELLYIKLWWWYYQVAEQTSQYVQPFWHDTGLWPDGHVKTSNTVIDCLLLLHSLTIITQNICRVNIHHRQSVLNKIKYYNSIRENLSVH